MCRPAAAIWVRHHATWQCCTSSHPAQIKWALVPLTGSPQVVHLLPALPPPSSQVASTHSAAVCFLGEHTGHAAWSLCTFPSSGATPRSLFTLLDLCSHSSPSSLLAPQRHHQNLSQPPTAPGGREGGVPRSCGPGHLGQCSARAHGHGF